MTGLSTSVQVTEPERTEVTPRPSLQELAGLFLADQDISDVSRAVYGRSLRQFLSWLEATGRRDRLSQLTREDVLAYKEAMRQAGLSAYTISSYLSVVRKLYGWLESKKLYPDISRGVKGSKRPRGFRRDCMTEEQLRQALQGMDASRLEGLLDFAIFNLLARTGLRTIEIARARIEHLRQESGEAVLWIRGKGRDTADEFVLLTQESLRPIRQYLSLRAKLQGQPEDEEPLFCSHSNRNDGQALTTRSISRIVKESLKRVGVDDKRLTAHSLRHTAITLAIKGGASLQQAQAMARHSDPRTTMIYFHNLDRISQGAERYISF